MIEKVSSEVDSMTPQLQTAIAAILPLSGIERQELIQILHQSDPVRTQPDLNVLSQKFWQGTTIEQLRTSQNPTTIQDLETLNADFWPKEDSIEDFLIFLQEQRQAVS
jgi:uncharacterized Zn finger protein